MKNLLNEKASKDLSGRLLFAADFVEDKDIISKKVLDLGCGFGWFELNALKRGAGRVIGLEISDKDLETARKNIKSNKVFFRVGSALSLPFPDQSFETVVSWDVIEHLPKNSERKMLKEVSRVLKKGGVFYLSTPNKTIVGCLMDPAWWLIGHRHYSLEELKNLANKMFLVEKYKIKGGLITLLSTGNLYFSKWILRRKLVFGEYFSRQIAKEYRQGEGFVSLFIKMLKK